MDRINVQAMLQETTVYKMYKQLAHNPIYVLAVKTKKSYFNLVEIIEKAKSIKLRENCWMVLMMS